MRYVVVGTIHANTVGSYSHITTHARHFVYYGYSNFNCRLGWTPFASLVLWILRRKFLWPNWLKLRGNTNYLLSSVVHTSSTFGIFTKEQPTITRGTHGWLFYCQVDNILVSKGFQYKGHSYRDEPKTWVQTDIPEQISSTFFFYLHW